MTAGKTTAAELRAEEAADHARLAERNRIALLAEKLDVSWWDHDRGEERSFAWLITDGVDFHEDAE
jgi:hypothetical protein